MHQFSDGWGLFDELLDEMECVSHQGHEHLLSPLQLSLSSVSLPYNCPSAAWALKCGMGVDVIWTSASAAYHRGGRLHVSLLRM